MSFAISSHERALQSFIHALGVFKAEICTRRASLSLAARTAQNSAQGAAAKFFETLACSKKGGFSEEFEAAALAAKAMGISRSDCEELLKLKSVLGRFDGATQACAIDSCIERLEQARSAASIEKNSTGKIMRTAGISIGIIIACIAL